MKFRFVIPLFCLVVIAGCIKPPSYPNEPQIAFKSISSNYIKSGGVDTITFTFTDGDGDISVSPGPGDTCNLCGLKNGDSACFYMPGFNVFLIDSRDTCVSFYASANIEPKGKFDDISGEILVIRNINSQKCFAPPQPGCPLDEVVYTILLRDRAGNFSNAIKTPPITIDGE